MTRLSVAHGAINLSQGFPDFPAPEEIKERIITDADRRAVDEFILAEKLAAIQRALDQDEQKRWEQRMATLVVNPVPVRVDPRMRPVSGEEASPSV